MTLLSLLVAHLQQVWSSYHLVSLLSVVTRRFETSLARLDKMHFSLATIIAVVPLLASASPLSQVPYVTINISKRTDVHHHDGSVNAEGLKGSVDASIKYFISLLDRLIPSHVFHSKAFYGFDTYQRNTGKRHPSQPDNYKRAIGELVVIKGHEHHWYGAYIEFTQVDFVLI
jgi:hypothetical protein